jgi:hypothetical protein
VLLLLLLRRFASVGTGALRGGFDVVVDVRLWGGGRESRNVDLCLGSVGLVVGLCLCLFCRSSLLDHGLGNVLLTLILDIVLLLPLFRNDSLLLVAGSCLPLWHIVCPSRRQTDLVGNSLPFLRIP